MNRSSSNSPLSCNTFPVQTWIIYRGYLLIILTLSATWKRQCNGRLLNKRFNCWLHGRNFERINTQASFRKSTFLTMTQRIVIKRVAFTLQRVWRHSSRSVESVLPARQNTCTSTTNSSTWSLGQQNLVFNSWWCWTDGFHRTFLLSNAAKQKLDWTNGSQHSGLEGKIFLNSTVADAGEKCKVWQLTTVKSTQKNNMWCSDR